MRQVLLLRYDNLVKIVLANIKHIKEVHNEFENSSKYIKTRKCHTPSFKLISECLPAEIHTTGQPRTTFTWKMCFVNPCGRNEKRPPSGAHRLRGIETSKFPAILLLWVHFENDIWKLLVDRYLIGPVKDMRHDAPLGRYVCLSRVICNSSRLLGVCRGTLLTEIIVDWFLSFGRFFFV